MAIIDPVLDDTPGAREVGFEASSHSDMSAILFDNLERNPDRTAVYAENGSVSYRTLCAQAARAGWAFKASGLGKGDRIVMLLDDRAEYIAAIFGAVRHGFVPVLANIQSPPDQLSYFLTDSRAAVLVIEADLLGNAREVLDKAADLRQIVVVGGSIGDNMAGGFTGELVEWRDFINGHDTTPAPSETSPYDMAFWMYSSGSTGKPKGVVHLHHDAAYTDLTFGRSLLKLSPGDIVYSVPKIFFAYGFGNSVTYPLSAGAAVVLATGRPESARVFDQIEHFKPSVFCGLPTLYNALIAHETAPKRNLDSIRLCISAAEILPEETFNAWKTHYGLDIIEGLGSTEMLHMYLTNWPGDFRLASAGKSVPGYEIELRDANDKPTPAGEPGIMWVRGHSSTPTYWNRPESTASTVRGSWIYTGDRFRQDADGFYYFLGRADDLIKVSGQWIYPLEIEHCLGDHPDVVDCAVLGVARSNGLMTTKAFVELYPGKQPGPELLRAMQDFVKSRLMPYKYPREIEFLTELPKTGTGKVDRQKLKAEHEKSLK